MTDEELIKWVENKFTKAGFTTDLDEGGRQFFISPRQGDPQFSFKVLIFDPDGPEPEISYYVGIEDTSFHADTSERTIEFFNAVFNEGCRLTQTYKGSIPYKEKLEICKNGNWEHFANGYTFWWPFWKKKKIKIIETKPINTRN